ncbi:hypothetical protein [Bordetella petrii]|uniref:hypothetical protein n=1 Tax=Bordetella petrii TaxID=94624 RepID=UPI0038B2DBC4
MREIIVSPCLDQNQLICRSMDFYDLMDLITFGQLTFDRVVPLRRRQRRGSSGVRYQHWTMFDDELSIEWSPLFEPSVHIVSSIRALADSLLTRDEMRIFIDRAPGVICSTRLSSARPKSAATTLQDRSLAVIAGPAKCSEAPDRERGSLRIPVDLETLLAGVIVSPLASPRYLEMVTALVQRTARASVSREKWCARRADTFQSTMCEFDRV